MVALIDSEKVSFETFLLCYEWFISKFRYPNGLLVNYLSYAKNGIYAGKHGSSEVDAFLGANTAHCTRVGTRSDRDKRYYLLCASFIVLIGYV